MFFSPNDFHGRPYFGTQATDDDDSEYEFLEPESPKSPGSDDYQTIPLLKERGGELRLDERALKSILNPKKLGERPIVVISVAGAFRMGKSFLLNFLLRYLQKEGWQPRNESWLEGWSSSENQGIKWKGGTEGDTRGILALKEPIMVKKSDGEELAVLLLDTQGNFEHGHSRESNVGIFALSTLFSSLQIFNISKQIQTNDVDYLQCFVEFAKISQPKKSSDVDSGAADHQRCFFQDLLFLVRDWQNPVSYPYGTDGGDGYLVSLSTSARDVSGHKFLNRAFSKVRCFLMPEPSTEVRITEKEGQNLEAKDLGKSFSRCIAEFVKEFINPDTLKPKTLGFAGPVTASVLFDHVKLCANKILSGGNPEFPSLMKLIASHANMKALEEVEKTFIAQVEEAITTMKEPSWAELEAVLSAEKLKAKKSFLDRTSFGREEVAAENNLEPFLDRIEATTPAVKKVMQRRRNFLFKQLIKTWMEESRERLKVGWRWLSFGRVLRIHRFEANAHNLGVLGEAAHRPISRLIKRKGQDSRLAVGNKFRQFPHTDVSELEKIRDARLQLLPNKDEEDPDSVTDQLEKAKLELLACCEENIHDARLRNREVTFMLAGSALIDVAVGGPIAAGGYLAGQLSFGGALGLLTGAGVAWKRGRDGFQSMRERFQQRYSRKDKTE